ncbi:hypothetical protein M0802_006885 [Mischocyttarus mexicanus]|nr:hypothetical protein M0802_006885 [Mischocyttarus mexicanus]
MQETNKCDPTTHTICPHFCLSRAAKKMTPQNVWSKMKHNVVDADTMKKYSVPCRMPMVPGPTASANTLTRAKAPLMKPKPRPQTYANTCLLSATGTTAYQSTDDKSKEMSQKKALAISMIILIGSLAIVNVNMANGGPKAKKAQPKKSITVILIVRMNA